MNKALAILCLALLSLTACDLKKDTAGAADTLVEQQRVDDCIRYNVKRNDEYWTAMNTELAQLSSNTDAALNGMMGGSTYSAPVASQGCKSMCANKWKMEEYEQECKKNPRYMIDLSR